MEDQQLEDQGEECLNCLRKKQRQQYDEERTLLISKRKQKELEKLYEEFGLLYRVYKPHTDSFGKYWPFICERCRFTVKEDLKDPSYRNYAWRFASYCINGNISTAVKFDFDTTNLKILQVEENTPKFTTKLKLSAANNNRVAVIKG